MASASNGNSLPRVAVLGPFGTYSHEAADQYFGPSAQYDEMLEIKDVFHALSSSSADIGVVPQENTIFGSVVETYDSLRSILGSSFVIGEVVLRIDHCLVARTGVALRDIHTVLSHEQALGQCKKFIATHLPSATTEKISSTARAARMLLDRPPGCAAICSRVCVNLFPGLEVLREAIQADSNNYTRFYVLARNRDLKRPRTSKLERNNTSNALLRISPIDINSEGPPSVQRVICALGEIVTRIDRRPLAGVPFRYVYFVEMQVEQAHVEAKLEELRGHAYNLDLIGLW